MITRLLTAAGIAALIAGSTSAQEFESTYTRIDEGCTVTEHEDEPVWDTVCPGFQGWEVVIVTGEHGSAEAYRTARGYTSEYINPPMLGLFGHYGDVIEWRHDADGLPFATIHRYFNDTPEMMDPDNAGEWQTLVVAALNAIDPQIACPVAFIDASSLPNANEIARQAADHLARGWNCRNDAPITFDANSEYDVMTIAAQRRPGH